MLSLAAFVAISTYGISVYCQSEAARLLTYICLLLVGVYFLAIALFTPDDLFPVFKAIVHFFSNLVEPHAFDGIARRLHEITKALIG